MSDTGFAPDLGILPFKQALTRAQDLSQGRIAQALNGLDGDVAQAMLYAVEGGKGLRAFLVMESARLFDIPRDVSATPAAAIEAMHAYSLVHDDLPCMDDDDMRRGKPTVHKKWNDTTAVLAGDALQTLAFQLAAETDCPAQQRVGLVSRLAGCSGIRTGMVAGQEMDIAAETAQEPLSLDQITQLQRAKTGALIIWSASAGAVMAGAEMEPLVVYGDRIGLAFQIADDILDVEGDASTVGKAVGKDEGRGKATFVSHLGLDGAKRRASQLVEDACDALSGYGKAAETLKEAARFVISRDS